MSESNPVYDDPKPQAGRVGLFVTCLVDVFRPRAGFAAARLLEQAGYLVDVPEQGCCGQTNFNGGDSIGAREMARSVIHAFADYDFVVVPSASCAAMIRIHYPALFPADDADAALAVKVAAKTWELTSFLVDVAKVDTCDASFSGQIVFHDSCSGLRELGISAQPRALLGSVRQLQTRDMPDPEVCCGFGGAFCVKYPDISARIADKKVDALKSIPDIDALTSTDLGCLMHMGGRLRRTGMDLPILHIAEILAGMPLPDSGGDE